MVIDVLKRLLAGGHDEPGRNPAPEPVDHNGYTIRPQPHRQGDCWLVAGTIASTDPADARERYFVRADSYGDRETAVSHAVTKGKQMIDLEGDGVLDRPSDTPPA